MNDYSPFQVYDVLSQRGLDHEQELPEGIRETYRRSVRKVKMLTRHEAEELAGAIKTAQTTFARRGVLSGRVNRESCVCRATSKKQRSFFCSRDKRRRHYSVRMAKDVG